VLPTPPEGLRHWRADDAPALAAAWSDPEITRWNEPPPDLDPARWIAGVEDRWARRLALDLVIEPDVSGEVGLSGFTTDPVRAELGIWVGAQHRRSGVATGAVETVARWALTDLGLDQLWARTDPTNRAAEALFERVGWDRRGVAGGKAIWSATTSVLR
jgi:RimJ/RimL family protein N-acetyltransferase